MDWFREHLYASSLTAVAVILFFGAYIVKERTPVSPNTSSTIAWGGAGGFFYPTVDKIGGTNDDIDRGLSDLYRQVPDNLPPWYSPPTQDLENSGDSDEKFDLEAFLALLSQESASSGDVETSGGSLLADAYSLIPRGFIATSSPEKIYTPTQRELRIYGNEAGLHIQAFERKNQNSMVRVLKDQIEDPENAEKIDAFITLADDLAGVGRALEGINDVPAQTTSVNARLAESYQAMGAKLALVPDAQTEEEKIAVMLAYNATVEKFIKNYVALTTLFSISEVTFRSDEPGSVFMFSGGGF